MKHVEETHNEIIEKIKQNAQMLFQAKPRCKHLATNYNICMGCGIEIIPELLRRKKKTKRKKPLTSR